MARIAAVLEGLEEERREERRQLAWVRRQAKERDPFLIPETNFINSYRLSKLAVRELFDEIEHLLPEDRRIGSITKMNKLLTTLNILAKGAYQQSVGDHLYLGMSQSSVSKCMHDVIDALNNPQTYLRHVKFPQNREERSHIVRGFYQKFGVPGVLGCIDGTHVALIRPTEHEERFYCRKRYHSRNVQIVCDSDLNILNLDASFGGATHDSFIWRYSDIHEHMKHLYENNEAVWFFGDAGYPLRPWLMTPILDAAPDTPEQHFYRKHCQLRNSVERCIGVLKARWRCLLAHRVLHYDHITVGKIIYACGVLHNIANRARLPVPELPMADVDQDRELQADPPVVPLPPNVVRRLYTDLQLGEQQRQHLVARLWVQRHH